MKITVNGSETEFENSLTIAGLLGKLSIDPLRAVVERNGAIVERTKIAEVFLADGDRLEIVRFVGGG